MALPVEIVRSHRRRKTVQAVVVDGVIRVHVPARLPPADEQAYVAELVERLERRFRSEHIDLDARARQLATRYGLPEPASVRWSEVQRKRWGSCRPDTGEIRVSSRLADFPSWVLDYVLVHELAHLEVADHSAAFQLLVDRYPRAERARGFLIAMAMVGDRAPAGGPVGTGAAADDTTGDEPWGQDGDSDWDDDLRARDGDDDGYGDGDPRWRDDLPDGLAVQGTLFSHELDG